MIRIMTVGALLLGVTACSITSPRGSEGDRSTGSTSSETPTAEAALREAGLTLPGSATDATVTTKDLPDRRRAWAVTFSAPRAEVEEFCSPMGGLGFRSSVPSTHRELLGDVPTSDETKGCESTSHDGGNWFRFVLVQPGDPATVHVSLQDMTR